MPRGLLFLALLAPVLCFSQETHEWQFANVAGNEIAWSCEGSGVPTYVLIAGMGLDAHSSFGRIYHGFDGEGRICMYDRAGMGKSTFADPHTRTLSELVTELHDVAVEAGWSDVILVPHSFGGFVARAYASKYANNTRGILFLDAMQEDWLPRLKAEMLPADWAIMERILEWNVRNFREDYVQAQEAVRKSQIRHDLPITVISRGIPHVQIRLEHMTYDGLDIFDNEHRILQAQLARLSSHSEHRIARYSSHMINDYDPWLVIDEMKRLAARVGPL